MKLGKYGMLKFNKTRACRLTEANPADVPGAAGFLLYLLLCKKDCQTIPGDLEEEFHTDIIPKFGLRRAKLWYWSQTLTTIATRNPICKWLLTGGAAVKLTDWLTRRITG